MVTKAENNIFPAWEFREVCSTVENTNLQSNKFIFQSFQSYLF